MVAAGFVKESGCIIYTVGDRRFVIHRSETGARLYLSSSDDEDETN